MHQLFILFSFSTCLQLINKVTVELIHGVLFWFIQGFIKKYRD